MVRSGVFVGVDKTGSLQKLRDAAAGAKRMHNWALDQGMVSPTRAKLITDADGARVSPDQIYDAIKEIIDGPGMDQLILYFAGHGVNINRGEHWLLSDAPVKASAAVNVSGSVELARYCGIGHVVIISDACRVAPEGIQAQNVRGIDVFPNNGASDRAKPVDQFFACLLGRTAAEISDPATAADNFCALYTGALLEAFNGKIPELFEVSDIPGDTALYIKPPRLEDYLEREIPRRVRAMNLERKVNQNPDAILTVHSNWLSKIMKPHGTKRGGRRLISPPRPDPLPGDLRAATTRLVQTAIEGPRELAGEISRLITKNVSEVQTLTRSVEEVAAPFGPDHFESQCGVKVRGTQIIDYVVPRSSVELLSPEILRIDLATGAMSVLLRFKGNFGAVIPAVAGFVTAITVQEGELVDVAYEPSANTWRWIEFTAKAAAVRALRAVAASASQYGRFRLDQTDALSIARKMQYAKSIDPTLAIYAAYAYHDVQAIESLRAMADFQRDDLGVTFFDLALLSRSLVGRSVNKDMAIVPFIPLFSQGWSLLGANHVRLPSVLKGVEEMMRDSVWSLFSSQGLDKLERVLLSGDVL